MSSSPFGYRFGSFELEVAERVLRRDGEVVALQDLPSRLLIALLEKAPDLVTRDELRRTLWPAGAHLDVDASLNTAVARVREALDDDPSQPCYLATVPRRGYKLVAAVERVAEEAEPSRRRWVAVAAVAAVILIAAWFASHRSRAPGPTTGDPVAEPARGESLNQAVAREHLLIARHYSDRRSKEGLEKAIASFQSAIALEPDNAPAYSGLAASYVLLGIYDYWRPREAFGPAETMARRAVELNPASAEAHLAMGLVAAVGHWDWDTARDEIERAVELAPDSAEAWHWQGGSLSAMGRHEAAIASTETALRLDPTSPVINTVLAWRLFQAGRDDAAIAQSHRTIELAPDYYDVWDNLKWIQLTLGNETEAVAAWIRAEELDNDSGAEIERIYRARGLEGLHRASIETQLERWHSGRYRSPYDIVLEYAAVGDRQQAMAWLERSLGERETDLVTLAVDRRLDPLRGEARFQEILTEIGIPRR